MGLSLTVESSEENENEKIDLSNLQMVKVKSTKQQTNKEQEQLSNLFVINDNAKQPKISPLDSFVNTDFFKEQEEEKENQDVNANVMRVKKTKSPIKSIRTGDSV